MAYRKMTCPECGKVLRPAKPVPAGKKVRCPECESVFYPEDAVNPVEAVEEDEPRGRPRRAEPARKAAARPAPKPDAESETYATIREETEEEEEERKPKIDYGLDTSIKDLRGPAQALVIPPSNKLTLVGFAGVFGWVALLILLMIPALFPLKPDETKKRPVMKIKPGLSHISAPASGAGGFPGGMPGGMPGGASGEKKAKIEEEKPGFYEIAGYDIGVIAELAWYWFLVALIPILLCTCWAAAVSVGAIKMQSLESRAWGIAGSILAMVPITVGGLQIVTALVVHGLLGLVIDDVAFLGYVSLVLTSIQWLLAVAVGVWSLMTLMNQDVIAGFEYKPE